jgi:SAM-dependent MidA family methyltransferase
VDVGAGRGELLCALLPALPEKVSGRLRAVAVELAPRPDGLPAGIGWTGTVPSELTGVLLATEWLDNVPLDVVEVDGAGTARYVLVDGAGDERLGGPVDPADADWLARWWPVVTDHARAEVGAPRDAAWAEAVSAVGRGLAVAVDYGHLHTARPPFGTLTGFRDGRQVRPVPDGTCDLTAHVAVDAAAHAGSVVAGTPATVSSQRASLRALGVDGRRPALDVARTDPGGYVRALAAASAAAELIDPAGLGGHCWILQPVGIPLTMERGTMLA